MSRQKDAYYFPHDYDSINDTKIQTLLDKFGAEGYGVYWRIIEILHKETDHNLPQERHVYIGIAREMSLTEEKVERIIEYCINPCKLFDGTSGIFWSNRVMENIARRKEISELKSKAGKASAEQRKKDREVAKIIKDSN